MDCNAQAQQQHEWLTKLVGEWAFESVADFGPDQPKLKSTGTETVRALGELWIVCEGRGKIPDADDEMSMRMTLGYDPRFAMLRDAIAARGGGLHRDAALAEQNHAAAVALVLRQAPALELLLIKRSSSEDDPWSGQMALPGGRRDPADAGLQHTAIRETHEEVGLDLRAHRSPMLG